MINLFLYYEGYDLTDILGFRNSEKYQDTTSCI